MKKKKYWDNLMARAQKVLRRAEKDPDVCTLRMANTMKEMAEAMAERRGE